MKGIMGTPPNTESTGMKTRTDARASDTDGSAQTLHRGRERRSTSKMLQALRSRLPPLAIDLTRELARALLEQLAADRAGLARRAADVALADVEQEGRHGSPPSAMRGP